MNARDAADLHDMLKRFNADGYMIVAVSRFTRSVILKLEGLERHGYYTERWARDELEQRLRRRQDLLARYADIVDAQ